MDPKRFINFLNDTLSMSNPGMVSVISHMEIASFQGRIFISIPDSVSSEDVSIIQSEIDKVPAKIKGQYPVLCFHKHNIGIKDPSSRAVIGEAIQNIVELAAGETAPKFLPSSVGFFLSFDNEIDEDIKHNAKEDIKLFGADSLFHRLIVFWGPDTEPEVFEFNKKTEAKKTPKASEPKVLLGELADPVRERTQHITEDDIVNLKILLQAADVNDVIAQLDTIGNEEELWRQSSSLISTSNRSPMRSRRRISASSLSSSTMTTTAWVKWSSN